LKNILARAPLLAPLLFIAACNSATTSDVTGSLPNASEPGRRIQTGHASWYGPGFHGRRTASGERFNSAAMTAAHRTLPFGTKVRVVDEETGRSVVVRINDRGPFKPGRVIDLARGPASALGLTSAGVARVALHQLD
jgi:rare lipoprotein A